VRLERRGLLREDDAREVQVMPDGRHAAMAGAHYQLERLLASDDLWVPTTRFQPCRVGGMRVVG
jgi:hypothetical protein